MVNKFLAGIGSVCIVCVPALASATSVYSINLSTQTLVRVDSTNGAVTNVGSGLGLSEQILDVDLTWANGFVWAAVETTTYQARLVKIDPTTGLGTAMSFNRPGNYFDYVEGLAVAGGKLFMTSTKTGGPLNYLSDGVFELDYNGNVLSEFGYRASDLYADFDCVEGLPDGSLLVLDNEPGSYKRFQKIGATSYSYNTIQSFSGDENYAVNDWILDGSQLIGINDYTFTVGRFDSTTGNLLGTQALSTGNGVRLRGAAYEPVPEPATLAALACGCVLMVRRRRK